MPTNKHGGKRPGAGAKPIGPSPLLSKTVSLAQSDIDFLATLDPHNLSAAIRKAVALLRSVSQ